MKKIILIIVVALLMSSCSANKNRDNVPHDNNSLSVYIGNNEYITELTLPLFKRKYPDIKVEIIKPQTDDITSEAGREEQNAFLASIMSGGGPDLLCSESFYGLMDYEEIISRGAAADMSEFYNADTELTSTLNQQIMDAGVIDGKRYLFPMGYTLPLLLSTQKTLDKFEFKEDNCPNYQSFLSETEKIIAGKTHLFSTIMAYLRMFYFSGVSPVDKKNATFITDLPELKITYNWLEKVTTLFNKENMFHNSFPFPEDLMALINGNSLFYSNSPEGTIDYSSYSTYWSLLTSVGETPVIFPVRNAIGGLTAQINNFAFVRTNSTNKENAYKFIQIMLSNEIQSNYQLRGLGLSGISVSKNAMDDFFAEINNMPISFPYVIGFPDERLRLTREAHYKYLEHIAEVNDVDYYSVLYNFTYKMINDLYNGKTYEESALEIKKEFEFNLSE